MALKLFVALIVVLAIVVGTLSLAMPKEYLVRLIIFRDFFDVSLPILGFGALVKYLCTCQLRDKQEK